VARKITKQGCGLLIESENKIVISEELQQLIDEVVKENPSIEWRICKKCGRELPIHSKFFRKQRKNYYSICKDCMNRDISILPIKYSKEDAIKIYLDGINNNGRQKIRKFFWDKSENIKTIVRYLILDVYQYNIDDIYNNVTKEFFDKHNIPRNKSFHGVLDTLKYCYPEYKFIPWKFKITSMGYWNFDEHKKEGILWLIEQLKEDNLITSENDIPKIIRSEIFRKYNLGGLLDIFECNNYELFNFIFPGRWKPYDFHKTTHKYFNNKDNRVDAVRNIFLNRLKYDRNDLLSITADDFRNNGIPAVLFTYYNGSPSKCIIECFPEFNLLHWEFKQTSHNYWQKQINRKNALRELIEIKLKLKEDEIPQKINLSFLRNCYCGFYEVLKKYYKSNIFLWINEVYPNRYQQKDFNLLIASDGTICRSFEEILIHNYIIDELKPDYLSYGKHQNSIENIFYNEYYNESYIADWIINKKVIVEHFGLFRNKPKDKIYVDYYNKTIRKVEFYEKYCKENNMKFIALFSKDIRSNLKGVKQKLSF
jgi:hypothetical protein